MADTNDELDNANTLSHQVQQVQEEMGRVLETKIDLEGLEICVEGIKQVNSVFVHINEIYAILFENCLNLGIQCNYQFVVRAKLWNPGSVSSVLRFWGF